MRTHRRLAAAAILCRSLAWFPVCMLLLSLRSSDGQIRILKAMLSEVMVTLNAADQVIMPSLTICGISLALQMTARMIGERFRTSPRTAFALKLAAAIPAAALSVFLVFRLSGSLFSAAVLTAAAVLLPLRKLDSPPDKLFCQEHFAAFLTSVLISALLLYIAELPMLTGWFFAVTAVVSVTYLLLCNRFMLLRLVNRRSNTEAPVPQDIQRGNLILVVGVILLFAAVFLFRKPLIALLCLMRDTAAKFCGYLLLLIIKADEKNAGIPEEEEIVEDVTNYLLTPGKASPLWALMWIPVIWVAWVIWRNLLSDWVFALRNAFERLLAFLRGGHVKAGRFTPPPDSDEYYDTETTERRGNSVKDIRRQWRRKLRAWKSLPDTREKFYAGYQLLLTAPVWEQKELRDADTVREIRQKWMQHHTPQEALDAVTEAFQHDRYAERGLPEQAIAELAAALDKLRG